MYVSNFSFQSHFPHVVGVSGKSGSQEFERSSHVVNWSFGPNGITCKFLALSSLGRDFELLFCFFFIQFDNDADSSSHKDDFGENQLVHGDLGENQLVDSASHEDLGNNQFVTYSESHEEDLGDNDGKQEVLTKTSPEIFEMSDD